VGDITAIFLCRYISQRQLLEIKAKLNLELNKCLKDCLDLSHNILLTVYVFIENKILMPGSVRLLRCWEG
jgi:hypothetical protein